MNALHCHSYGGMYGPGSLFPAVCSRGILWPRSLSLATEVKLNQHADVVLGVPLFAMMDTHVIEGVVAELEPHVYLAGT